jgi:hypothetical protein
MKMILTTYFVLPLKKSSDGGDRDGISDVSNR